VTEVELTEALNALGGNRTQLIVAHRLSTIVDSDIIVVMKSGQICEQGSHHSLLKLNGVYADMWSRQSRVSGEVDEDDEDGKGEAETGGKDGQDGEDDEVDTWKVRSDIFTLDR
jgi:ABC-type multidrug transport system ATPase subunit